MFINNDGETRFETYSEAAKHFGVSTGVIRNRFHNFEITKMDLFDFPLYVNGIGFRTFHDARKTFNLSAKKLDEIIMGSKRFHFVQENVVSVPKPIQMVYDLKKMLGDKFNLGNALMKKINHSGNNIFSNDLVNENLARLDENYDLPPPDDEDSSDEEEEDSSDEDEEDD